MNDCICNQLIKKGFSPFSLILRTVIYTVISYQLSAISYQLSAISYQLK
ncbi:hypothetical protein PSM_B0630 [Pseudoalteromonas sp. SM9913]|nr:hypothetical protein PSM_B0630 [Pseudoalteromonas sp. SM9913]